jgi:hypothetical protein
MWNANPIRYFRNGAADYYHQMPKVTMRKSSQKACRDLSAAVSDFRDRRWFMAWIVLSILSKDCVGQQKAAVQCISGFFDGAA